MEPRKFPKGVPRLFDLIQLAEERFRPAFYHYLRDTLVTTNTQQATEVADGRQMFRVVMVTLGGELIETTGTMTGGGRSKISGKMGQQSAIVDKISPREFERMERSINMEEINYEITAIVENLTKTKPNMAAIAEYKKKEEVKHIPSNSCRKY